MSLVSSYMPWQSVNWLRERSMPIYFSANFHFQTLELIRKSSMIVQVIQIVLFTIHPKVF